MSRANHRSSSSAPRKFRVRSRSQPADAGQVTPLVAIAVVAVAGLAIVVALVAGVLVARAQAQTAADAAALAGAVEGRAGADDLATRNGAHVVAFTVQGSETEVEVAIGPVTARARAERRQ